VVNDVEGELVGTGASEVETMGVSMTADSTVGSAEGVVVEVQVVVSTTRLTVKVV